MAQASQCDEDCNNLTRNPSLCFDPQLLAEMAKDLFPCCPRFPTPPNADRSFVWPCPSAGSPPCFDSGCYEPAEAQCCEDPDCDEINACMQCLEEPIPHCAHPCDLLCQDNDQACQFGDVCHPDPCYPDPCHPDPCHLDQTCYPDQPCFPDQTCHFEQPCHFDEVCHPYESYEQPCQHYDQPCEPCTTCCMSDICLHQPHSQNLKPTVPPPPGYMPWQPHEHKHPHPHPSICTSLRDSVEPRLSAALQSQQPTVTRTPSLSVTTETRSATSQPSPETPQRGGHRRLQGTSAQSADGLYSCHWTVDMADGRTCTEVFTDPQALHEHVQSSHFAGSCSNHPCHWFGCDSGSFNTKPKLGRHLHSHTNYKPHACTFPGCGLTFVTQQQRDVHCKKHTGEKPFSCEECGRAFAYMDLLKSHLRSGVHGKAEKKFPCAICGEGFSDSSNRTKHTKSVHDPVVGVPCPGGCSYVDTRREKLRQHCESAGHGLEIVRDPRAWEDYFGREQALRKPNKGLKRKRGAAGSAPVLAKAL